MKITPSFINHRKPATSFYTKTDINSPSEICFDFFKL